MSTVPVIAYPPELPVSQRRDEIADAIRDHQVVIVAGATGSGKTTQLPKICLELGRRSIGHTQPRRIAARTIAERVAEELGSELGGLVGYQVRFTDRVSADTRIKVMTDGILLNELHHDRRLERYDTIIIDEAHERSLTIDFLLGYLKQLLPQRPELKVIVTSATIDPERFARHFADAAGAPAPIIEVSGRTYPVEIRYRPLAPDAPSDDDDLDTASPTAGQRQPPSRRGSAELSSVSRGRSDNNSAQPQGGARGRGRDANAAGEGMDLMEGITAALDELAREAPGDVLVFLSGENEIRDAEDAVRGRYGARGDTEVLPLYGRLSAADQHRVFESRRAPGIRRRIVLATNVAETSLTVPGIKYVIDGGTARISRYSPRAKVQRLPIEAISQASANQRSGRGGRTSDGIAIRLYAEDDFERRPEFTEPEILRTNLAAVILQMIALGLGDIERFPFLEPPDSRGVRDGLDLLRELGAIDRDGGITRVGRQLTRLPIDPRFARMIIEAKAQGCVAEVIAITAALSIQDPRERPLEKRAHADQLHARFTDPGSDFITLLNLWRYLAEQQRELSSSAFRRLCKAEFINYLRVREWQDVVRQLTRAARDLGMHIAKADAAPAAGDAVHRALLAGLLSHLGLRDTQRKDYAGARNQRFSIFPGSGLAKRQPAAIMAAELVETSRLFARTAAAIDPAWAEPLAGDLVRRTYAEPHWEKRQGAVIAWERVTLYGVPIVQRRRAQYARIDPEHSRELFIRHALVEGDWDVSRISRALLQFDRTNRALRKRLEQLEERTRRRDILYDDEAIFEFYDRRIPATVSSVRDFEKWWRVASRDTPELLTMTPENLAAEAQVDDEQYPTLWRQGDQTLSLGYRFEPGAADDGVTAKIPLPLLAALEPTGFDWLVPGLREELVTALIKTLPKAIRRNVVPAADWARRLLEAMPASADVTEVELTEFLATEIRRQTHTPVSAEDFELDRLPPHLRVTFAVTDDRGGILARSKDLASLQHKLKTRARDSVARTTTRSAPTSIEREGVRAWDFGELPRVIDTRRGGGVVRAYPTLVDAGETAAIRLLSTPADQEREQPRGIGRLLALTVPSPLAYVRDHLSQREKLALAASPYRSTQALFDDCLDACLDATLREHHADGLLWAPEAFESVRRAASAGLVDQLYAVVGVVSQTLSAQRDAERAMKAATSMAVLPAVADAREQLAAIVHPGFVSRTGVAQLRHLPRYLRGIVERMDRLAADVGRDRTRMNEVAAATAAYTAAGGQLPLDADAPEPIRHARWMLEELRVSLFAQHLGTGEPVSLQRIQKLLR